MGRESSKRWNADREVHFFTAWRNGYHKVCSSTSEVNTYILVLRILFYNAWIILVMPNSPPAGIRIHAWTEILTDWTLTDAGCGWKCLNTIIYFNRKNACRSAKSKKERGGDVLMVLSSASPSLRKYNQFIYFPCYVFICKGIASVGGL